MLERKIYKEMIDWKQSHGNQALLITGARQVGKTYIVDEFCKDNYDKVIKFDLIEQSDVRESFQSAKNSEELKLIISSYSSEPLNAPNTVVFIDEIQACDNAMVLVKYLVQNSLCDYILSGSLLGVELNNVTSLPVGYLRIMEMYPLDFEEFCLANSFGEQAWNEVKDAFFNVRPVLDGVHKRMMSLFHQYLVVGGMPRVVDAFVKNRDISEVMSTQNDILKLYRYDISKYAGRDKSLSIKSIFDAIPAQLNSQSKKFNFSTLAKKGTFERYEESFVWMMDSAVAIPVLNVAEPLYPLKLVEKSSNFKLFMNDVGLLSCSIGVKAVRDVLSHKVNINYGSIYENFVAQELNTKEVSIWFFRNKAMGEVDFLIQRNGRVIPIEVKSGKDYHRHNALTKLFETKNYDIKRAYVLCESNIKVMGDLIYCPAYMVTFL